MMFALSFLTLGNPAAAQPEPLVPFTLREGEDAWSVVDDCRLPSVWNLKEAIEDDLPINPFEASTVMIPESCAEQMVALPAGWSFYRVTDASPLTFEDIALEVIGDSAQSTFLSAPSADAAPSTLPLVPGTYIYYPEVVGDTETSSPDAVWRPHVLDVDTSVEAIAEQLLYDSDAWLDIKLDRDGTRAESQDTVLAAGSTVYTRLFQGDSVVTSEEYAQLFHEDGMPYFLAAAVSANSRRWPAKEKIPYCVSSEVNSEDERAIRSAVAHIEDKTCIRFKEVSCSSSFRIKFFIDPDVYDRSCWSWVGMRYFGGEIASGGCGMGTMVHEVGHAIGLKHEQSRSDRDDHITVNWNKIDSDWRDQYDKENTDNSITPYDYGSIMHYSARGGRMTAKTGSSDTNKMGNRQGLTRWDIVAFNYLLGYEGGCGNNPTPAPTPRPGTGGGGSCAAQPWPFWDNVDCGDCWALVSTSPYDNCKQYCESFGHTCQGAAEEVDEDCNQKSTYQCTSSFSFTPDMLCKCVKGGGNTPTRKPTPRPTTPKPTPRPTPRPNNPPAGSCNAVSSFPLLKRECSNCWALVEIKAPTWGRCDAYCESFGHVCKGAAEEVSNDCNQAKTFSCSAPVRSISGGRTTDMLCQCEKSGAPSPTPKPPTPSNTGGGGTCRDPSRWPDWDRVTCTDCWALVKTSSHGNCNDYCQSFGHVCHGAAEEQDEDCAVKRKYSCSADIKDITGSSDILCQCKKPSRDEPKLGAMVTTPNCAQGTPWPDVKQQCNGRECTVLVDQFTSKYQGKCSTYCQTVGKKCSRAWEQVADSCESLLALDCDEAPGFKTTDAVCECANLDETDPEPLDVDVGTYDDDEAATGSAGRTAAGQALLLASAAFFLC